VIGFSLLSHGDGSDTGVKISNGVNTDVAGIICVQFLGLEEIEVDGETPSNDEECKGNYQGLASSDVVSNISENGWDNSATTNGSDEEGSSALSVATETTEGEGEDCWEDARLEEEHEHEHGKATPVGFSLPTSVCANGGGNEHHDEGLIGEKDVAWLSDVHQSSGGETANGEQALSNGVVIGALFLSNEGGKIGTGLFVEVDKVTRNGNLCTDIGELSSNTLDY
jgi:hypothetical protein